MGVGDSSLGAIDSPTSNDTFPDPQDFGTTLGRRVRWSVRAEASRLRPTVCRPDPRDRLWIFENKVGPFEVTRVGVLRRLPGSHELGGRQVVIARFLPFKLNMKGLILAQSERWRRGSDMLVERESGGNSV